MSGSTDKTEMGYSLFSSNLSDKNRKNTDRPFIYLAIIVFAVWFGLSIYALNSAPTFRFEENQTFMYILKKYENINIESIIFLTLIGGVVTYGGLFGACVIPNVYVVAVNIFFIFIFLAFVQEFYTSLINKLVFESMENFFNIFHITVILVCVHRVGIKSISKFIQKLCWFVFSFPSLFLFGLVILFLNAVVLGFTVFIMFINSFTSWVSLILIPTIYICIFIIFFGAAVISLTISTGHRNQNSEDVSKNTILHSVRTVARYHLGSVAYLSTIIFPVFQAIYVHCKFEFDSDRENNIFFKIYNTLYVILHAPEYTLLLISTVGHDSQEALKRAFYLFMKYSEQTIAYTSVSKVLLFLIFGFGWVIAIFPIIGRPSAMTNTLDTVLLLIPTVVLLAVLSFPVIIIAVVTADTILLCILQDQDEDESEEISNGVSQNKSFIAELDGCKWMNISEKNKSEGALDSKKISIIDNIESNTNLYP